MYPILPEPTGRFKFVKKTIVLNCILKDFFHPLAMIKEILGPELYRKMCMIICLVILVIVLIGFGYLIFA